VKQVRQFLRGGHIETGHVPCPGIHADEVLVRTHFSFVSVGTEKMKVSQARMSLVEKARERPDQVRQILQALKEQGLAATIRKVQERLAAPMTLGYSCAGVVVAIGPNVDEFRVGDRVAAIGEGIATHAEYNAIPRNLVVATPPGVSLEAASSSAIGAITIQSVRQARLELGETVAIIGLGLLGQFLLQLCRANGCRVIGIDLDAAKCQLAMQHGAEAACGPDGQEALLAALRVSNGSGVDAVFITTSTKSNQPVEMAAELVRDRGRVVCLGNTEINLDWRTWFGKEIDFLFSRAMGPGIFDPDYFTRGKDYPIGYVRWSANRNMASFLDLVAQKKIDLSKLISHRFAFSEAQNVFDQIAGGHLSSAVGILFEYPDADFSKPDSTLRTLQLGHDHSRDGVRLGVIGAGNYAKSMILPHLQRLPGLSLEAVCTARGMNAEALARRYGFRKATTDSQEVISDERVNAVAIATRHDSHARYVCEALRAGKHAYVEKPLAMDDEQLAAILEALSGRSESGATLWVGHNRRFAPLSIRAMAHMHGVQVRQVFCTVRTAAVPAESWYQDATEGGGMLFGDVCHFVDLAIWFQQSAPAEVHAFATRDPSHREDSWAVQLRFASGGLSTIHYVCGSQQGWDRETIDVLGGGRSARIAGFQRLTLNGPGASKSRTLQPDLGQKAMLAAMIAQFSHAAGSTDYTDSYVMSAQAVLAVQRSIRERRVVLIDTSFPYHLS
jgi:predicted dehydrogenase